MIDSRPEPSSPATPTTSPTPTSAVRSATLPPARPRDGRGGRWRCVAAAERGGASEIARPRISSTSWSWSSAPRATVATRRPSRSTVTRSAIASTSSR